MRWSILALIVILSSCTLTGAATTENQASVDITSDTIVPIVIFIKPGTMVTWTNKDNEPHTVTILGQFDSGVLGRRHTFSHTFDKEGTFTYKDLFDTERIAKVVVKK